MKKKLFYGGLAAEAVLCLLLHNKSTTSQMVEAMAFPFAQIGAFLRTLSLAGKAGNTMALVLLVAFSLLPLGVFWKVGRRRRRCPEDGLLVLLAPLLAVVLYYMVNPTHIALWMQAGQAMGQLLLGGGVYSLLCCYGVLRAVRLAQAADMRGLLGILRVALAALTAFFVWVAFGPCWQDFLASLQAFQDNNNGYVPWAWLQYLMLALQSMVRALPYLLDAWVALAGLQLLHCLGREGETTLALSAADRLCRHAALALSITVVANGALYLLQLALAGVLRTISAMVQLPLVSFVFLLFVLLLARLVQENGRLQDDNNMFI